MNRIAALVVSLALLTLGCSAAARADTVTLDVSATIDGQDDLIITPTGLQWEHLYFQGPTGVALTTTLNGVTQLNNASWSLAGFSDCYPAACAQYSSTAFPTWANSESFANSAVALTSESGRGSVSLLQAGTSANGFTTILQFNDNAFGSSAPYEAKLTFSNLAPVPLPAGIWLLLTGLLPLLLLARRPRVGQTGAGLRHLSAA